MTENVVEFPSRALAGTGLPQTMAEIDRHVENVRHVFVNEITEIVMNTAAQQMMAAGFDILDDEHKKDFGLVIEAVRSCMCKSIALYHPFQEVSEEIMEEIDDEDGTSLIIADSINLKFRATEQEVPETEIST